MPFGKCKNCSKEKNFTTFIQLVYKATVGFPSTFKVFLFIKCRSSVEKKNIYRLCFGVLYGFIRSQTRRNSTTSTIAEAHLDITGSIFVRSRQRSTTCRLKHSSIPCGVNSTRLQVRGFVYHLLLFCISNQAQRSNNVHDVL